MQATTSRLIAQIRANASFFSLPNSNPVAQRSFQTSSITLAAKKKKGGNKKQSRAAIQKAEAEAEQQRIEELRRLKDTKFLNSLISPKNLFATTQLTQQQASQLASAEQEKKSQATTPDNADAAASAATAGAQKAVDNTSNFHSFVTPSEIEMITKHAPKASLELDRGNNLLIRTAVQEKLAFSQGEMVKRIVALENADSKAVMHANINTAVETFARKEHDTGSPEVQAAVWTVRINNLGQHLASNRKDHHNRRRYTYLLHKRAKMLRYLKRQSLERYHRCLKELGLQPEMVEGEIPFPRRVELGAYY
ncbi:hypothetical protein H4219_004725 [Mycoemilia scoparia]|uniref:28S ribosomal protein S15, mitochondrial n=1 Tax=Mycoemilia scoparia TaxID=417184 RepID=A0A9W8DRD4_9FUNG|nr:hypothetical protein H4219_004725 [Mycoemilia scoparia]